MNKNRFFSPKKFFFGFFLIIDRFFFGETDPIKNKKGGKKIGALFFQTRHSGIFWVRYGTEHLSVRVRYGTELVPVRVRYGTQGTRYGYGTVR